MRANWLIVHGSADSVVAVSDARLLLAANSRGDHGMVAELRVIDGANHTFGASHPMTGASGHLATAITTTADFFARELSRGQSR